MKNITELCRTLAFEDANAKLKREKEIIIYANIESIEDLNFELSKAKRHIKCHDYSFRTTKQVDEDKEIKLDCRVRKITENDTDTYTLTHKLRTIEAGNNLEIENDASEALFNVFSQVATRVGVKERFIFDAGNGLEWEVDLYYTTEGVDSTYPPVRWDGLFNGWCRIELECDSFDIDLPALPLSVDKAIIQKGNSLTEEESKIINDLYEAGMFERTV